MKKYDYLVVGAGLYGAVSAYKVKQSGKKCLVIDKRPHLGGYISYLQQEGLGFCQFYCRI